MKDPDTKVKLTAHTIRKDYLDLLNDYARNEEAPRSRIITRALKEYFKRERLLQKDGHTPKKKWKRSRV